MPPERQRGKSAFFLTKPDVCGQTPACRPDSRTRCARRLPVFARQTFRRSANAYRRFFRAAKNAHAVLTAIEQEHNAAVLPLKPAKPCMQAIFAAAAIHIQHIQCRQGLVHAYRDCILLSPRTFDQHNMQSIGVSLAVGVRDEIAALACTMSVSPPCTATLHGGCAA